MDTNKIELGDKVKDRISGLDGVVVCITYWLYGCVRVSVQPQSYKEWKPSEIFTIDMPQLELIEKNVLSEVTTLNTNTKNETNSCGFREAVELRKNPVR